MILEWQFTGPIPLDHTYQVELMDANEQFTTITHQLPAVANFNSIRLGSRVDGGTILASRYTQVAGTQALVRVQLVRPDQTVAEIGNRAVTLDTTTGLAFLQTEITTAPPVQGGFTESDRAVQADIKLATFASLPLTTAVPALASLALSLFPKEPPIDLLSEGETLLLQGRSSITRPSGTTGVYAYGGRWRIVSAPAGLGKLDGQVLEYEQRIVQWSVVKNRLGGGLYSAILEENHHENGELAWPIPFPVRVDFDILPGVTIEWKWLLFLQPPV